MTSHQVSLHCAPPAVCPRALVPRMMMVALGAVTPVGVSPVLFLQVACVCMATSPRRAVFNEMFFNEKCDAPQVGHPPPGGSRDGVTLLTRGGSLLSLRRDLRVPFAAWLASQALAAGSGGAGLAIGAGGLGPRGSGLIGAEGLALDSFRRFEVAAVQLQVSGRRLRV